MNLDEYYFIKSKLVSVEIPSYAYQYPNCSWWYTERDYRILVSLGMVENSQHLFGIK